VPLPIEPPDDRLPVPDVEPPPVPVLPLLMPLPLPLRSLREPLFVDPLMPLPDELPFFIEPPLPSRISLELPVVGTAGGTVVRSGAARAHGAAQRTLLTGHTLLLRRRPTAAHAARPAAR
jgi:hypothetical protein